jgi:hypothetical protein
MQSVPYFPRNDLTTLERSQTCYIFIYIDVEESRPPLWSSSQSSWLQNGDILCFLWGTNWIYIWYVEESRPSLWFSGQSSWLRNGNILCFLWGTNWIYICYIDSSQSSWLEIQGFGFDSWRYQIFREVVGLERGPLSLVSKTEELLERKSRGSGLESREYYRRDPLCWPRNTVYPLELALTSPTIGGPSIGVVCSRTEATDLLLLITYLGSSSFLPEVVSLTNLNSWGYLK